MDWGLVRAESESICNLVPFGLRQCVDSEGTEKSEAGCGSKTLGEDALDAQDELAHPGRCRNFVKQHDRMLARQRENKRKACQRHHTPDCGYHSDSSRVRYHSKHFTFAAAR